MKVVHMSGAGNTFLLLDDRAHPTVAGALAAGLVRDLIAEHPRNDGHLIEGLIRIRSIEHRGAVAEFYNPDGTRGMLCGNGARCAVRYALDNGAMTSGPLELTFNGVDYQAMVHDDASISVTLPPPSQLRYFPAGSLDDVNVPVWYANVHSDHVVIDAPHDVSNPLISVLRHHPDFPRGTNVNMLLADDYHTLRLATFERGVEAITQACGTGAVSAALSMWMRNPSTHSFTIIPPSGRHLLVRINEDGGQINSLELRGDATYDNS